MRPLETRSSQQIELISEFLILALFSNLLCLTGLVNDLDVRYFIGWSIVCIVSLDMILSFGNVLRITVLGLIHKIKLYTLKKEF